MLFFSAYANVEYGEGGQVSSRGDIYSFGSVILELFTGMSPTHDMFRDGLTLQKHAENAAFAGMLMQITTTNSCLAQVVSCMRCQICMTFIVRGKRQSCLGWKLHTTVLLWETTFIGT